MKSENNNIQRVVIVGGGTAGWISAAALSRVLPRSDFSITLVESDQIGTVGVGEATIPPIRDFHRMLGINEVEMIRKTNASFKLGIEFSNWQEVGKRYFHPFGEYGRKIDSVAFHQYFMRGASLQDCGDLSEYSLCTMAAMAAKFAPPSTDRSSILSSMAYAYHFDATAYAKFLRQYSEDLGVQRTEGKVVDVQLNSENGFIEAIQLESSEKIDGDLFIDCTGFASLLIGRALGVKFEDWSHYLPANRAVAVQTKSPDTPILPYTKSIAHAAGWQWSIPLQHRSGNGLVFSDEFMSEEQAQELLMNNLPETATTEAISEPRILKFVTGKRQQAWRKNCVAIGLSSGFLEPLESTSIHLIQTAITRLLSLFPGSEFCQADIDQFNLEVSEELEFVRDFIILHYHQNNRDEPLWEYCRNMSIPISLQRRIDLFTNRGRIVEDQYDLFKTASWVAVMAGQGIQPKGYDPIAENKPQQRLLGLLQEMRKAYREASRAMPSHAEFIAQNCAA